MHTTSPAQVKRLFKRAWYQAVQHWASTAIQARLPPAPVQGARLDFSHLVDVAKKYKKAGEYSKLRLLTRIVAGQVWTADRMQAHRDTGDGSCPLCHQPESPGHQLFECPYNDHLRHSEVQKDLEDHAAKPEETQHVLRGIIPEEGFSRPGHDYQPVFWCHPEHPWDEASPFFRARWGRIYTDGSGRYLDHRGMETAGCAAVQLGEDMKPVRIWYLPLP